MSGPEEQGLYRHRSIARQSVNALTYIDLVTVSKELNARSGVLDPL
jgi:hypothetical protein